MAERTAEEWGRVAVALPGWRWMPGMHTPEGVVREVERQDDGEWLIWVGQRDQWEPASRMMPSCDDPATAGCLLALLGPEAAHMTTAVFIRPGAVEIDLLVGPTVVYRGAGPVRTLGRACIAAAEALGRWAGGDHG